MGYYVSGVGTFGNQRITYTDKNGELHTGGGRVHTADGRLVPGNLMDANGNYVRFGGKYGSGWVGTKEPQEYIAPKAQRDSRRLIPTPSGRGYVAPAELIDRWRRGEPLNPMELATIHSYSQDKTNQQFQGGVGGAASNGGGAASNGGGVREEYRGQASGKDRYKKLTDGTTYDNLLKRKLTAVEEFKYLN